MRVLFSTHACCVLGNVQVKLSFTSRDTEALAAAVADVRQALGDVFIEPPPAATVQSPSK